MTVSSAQRPYFQVLDSLRGVAAVMVALFHFRAGTHLEDVALLRNSWMFVDFFFVLSGFVIAANYRDRLQTGLVSLRDFMILRIFRIVPLHFVMLALFVITEMLILLVGTVIVLPNPAFTGSRDPWLILENLALLQSLGISGVVSWNGPSWSISAEIWTYLIYALALVGGIMARRAYLGLSLVIAPLLVLIRFDGSLAMEADFGILRCLIGFAVGTLVWRVQETHGALAAAGRLELPVMLLVLGVVAYGPGLQLTLAAPLVFALAVHVFTAEAGWLSRILLRPGFLFLGLVSYSIYMVHIYIFARLANVLLLLGKFAPGLLPANGTAGQMWLSDAVLVASLAITIPVSYLTWKLIEKPGQALGRRLVARSKPHEARAEQSGS